MKNNLTLIAALALATVAYSQNQVDALRYSQLGFGGTARFNSMAGAYGALGSDFSTLSFNPAGLGMYRKSEVSFSPSVFYSATSSSYNGTSTGDDKLNFNFGNAGFVLTGRDESEKATWKGISLGFGYNRLANFHNRIFISGENKTSSMLDVFLAQSQGSSYDNLDQFGAQLAFDTWLIDSVNNGTYYSVLPNYGQTQTKSVETRGAVNEMVFSFAGSYKDKLYIGGTLGFPRINYSEEYTYTESLENDTMYGFKRYDYNYDLYTTGRGFNAKFGLIYRPLDAVRLGFAVHTPTYYNLKDSWSASMNSYFQGGTYSAQSPTGNYDYSLTTPARAIGSIAIVIKKYGLISADYEFIDYATARLRRGGGNGFGGGYAYASENNAIKKSYGAASNIRVGGELKVNPFSIRAGYALYGSPFKNNINDASTTSYTAGLGFREDDFYIDLAYVYSKSKQGYYLYDANLVDAATNITTSSNFMFTLGFRF